MLKWRWAYVAAFVVLVLMPAAVFGVHLRGKVFYVGLSGTQTGENDRSGHHYRIGTWTPIYIELNNDDSDQFVGRVEVRQADRDGDGVVASRDVVVTDSRRCFLYVPGGWYERPGQFNVQVYNDKGRLAELYDDQGEPIKELPVPGELTAVPAETQVILDISAKPITQLRRLVKDEQLIRELFVARMSPADLPDAFAGLDLVDVIVWDGADPSAVDLPQRNALMEWTRQGGTLIIGVSRNWDRLLKSKLNDILPARLTGMAMMSETPEWLLAWLGIGVFDIAGGRLDPPVNYCPVSSADLADGAVAIVPDSNRDQDLISSANPADQHLLVTKRSCGRGQVILVAAELHDILQHGRRNPAMLCQLLGIRRRQVSEQQQYGFSFDTDLFGQYVQQKTAFSVTAGLYLFLACAFVVGYISLGTAGSWVWLKRKKWTQYAWIGFAVVAIAASMVSVLAVQWIRGISHRVQELSIVDTHAGSDKAVATCYFGIKSPAHNRLDLRVPAKWQVPDEPGENHCLLGPQPADPFRQIKYSAAQRYEALAGLGELREVPLRATLKQLEAYWRGTLPGTLNASLKRVRSQSVELSGDSWIENDLGTDLRDCYLFVTARDVESDRAHRNRSIEVYRIGMIPSDMKVTWQQLSQRITAQADLDPKASQQTLQTPSPARQLRRSLLNCQREWLLSLGIRSQDAYRHERQRTKITQEHFVSALLLLTLYQEIDRDEILQNGYDLIRSQGQRLDSSDRLTRDTALFIGFSQDPGPTRLCYRLSGDSGRGFKAIKPGQADVVYRVAIPIEGP